MMKEKTKTRGLGLDLVVKTMTLGRRRQTMARTPRMVRMITMMVMRTRMLMTIYNPQIIGSASLLHL
jgi:hypothetical protein